MTYLRQSSLSVRSMLRATNIAPQLVGSTGQATGNAAKLQLARSPIRYSSPWHAANASGWTRAFPDLPAATNRTFTSHEPHSFTRGGLRHNDAESKPSHQLLHNAAWPHGLPSTAAKNASCTEHLSSASASNLSMCCATGGPDERSNTIHPSTKTKQTTASLHPEPPPHRLFETASPHDSSPSTTRSLCHREPLHPIPSDSTTAMPSMHPCRSQSTLCRTPSVGVRAALAATKSGPGPDEFLLSTNYAELTRMRPLLHSTDKDSGALHNIAEMHQQGSNTWHRARRQRLTASSIAKVTGLMPRCGIN